MTTRRSIPMAVLSLVLLAGTAQAAESLSVLLQKGIFAEETEGNLDAAIQIYEGIVKEADANRSLVAQAQYRLGVCRLKQGRQEEAAAAFRKLIEQYSGAVELVAQSRERLAELGQPALSVIVRQIWSGKDAAGDSISPDGRYLAFIDRTSGNLAVRDVTTGQNRRLTSEASWEEPNQFAESCAFSRDGKQVAYSWYGANGCYSLRLLNLDDPKPRVLMESKTNGWLSAEDWSPDGNSIAVFDSEKRGTNWQNALALVSTASGGLRRISDVGTSEVCSTLRFSPDGRYLAYNLGEVQRTFPNRRVRNDIHVVDVETGTRKFAVENVASEQFVDWSPQGSEIVFISERRETADLWSLRVRNGQPEGSPRLLWSGLGEARPVGLTRNGTLYYSRANDLGEAYYAAVDFETGKTLSSPRLLQASVPGITSKETAPGRYVYFRAGAKDSSAYVLDMETGRKREIQNSREWASRIGWWWPSPDGRFVVVALQLGSDRGLHLLNLQSDGLTPLAVDKPGVVHTQIGDAFQGETVSFLRHYEESKKVFLVRHNIKDKREREYEVPDGPASRGRGYGVLLFADGRTLIFKRSKPEENLHLIIGQDLETGMQKELFRSKDPTVGALQNQEGDLLRLAFDDTQKRRNYRLFSIANLELKEILTATLPEHLTWISELWRGPYVILEKKIDQNPRVPKEVWRFSVKTGELKKLELTLSENQTLGIEPQGKWVLLRTANRFGLTEVWALENVLPPVAAAK